MFEYAITSSYQLNSYDSETILDSLFPLEKDFDSK